MEMKEGQLAWTRFHIIVLLAVGLEFVEGIWNAMKD